MNWNYVPFASSIDDFAHGRWGEGAKTLGADLATGGLYSPISSGVNAYTSATDKQTQGLGTAAQQSRELGEYLKNFQMEGLNKAQGYFQPAQERINAVYGSPGSFRK